MGKWDRRYYVPNRGTKNKYKNWDQAPHMAFNWDDNDPSVGTERGNRVPSWEIEYCKSARVPWNKVVASKKYIVCYPTVLDWDGSASEEALENAKQRYWAMINNLPCDIPLPDPDMYIENIDWNSYLDPELMEDLDRQFFNPDESCSDDRLETINENAASFEVNNDKNQPTVENPWERNFVQSSESIKDATQGWGQWGHSVNLSTENPWKQSSNQAADSWSDNAWKSGNESSGWDQPARQEGGGTRDVNSWGWDDRNATVNHRDWNETDASDNKPINLGNYKPSWGNQNSNGRNWRENGNQSWGRRDSEFQVGDSNNYNSSRTSFRGGCRKRESSVQYTSNWRENGNQSWGSRRDSEFQVGDSNNYNSSGTSFRGGCRKRESSAQYTSNCKSSRYQDYNNRYGRQV